MGRDKMYLLMLYYELWYNRSFILHTMSKDSDIKELNCKSNFEAERQIL